MNKVIVFRSDLLPTSETFIKEQTLSLIHWTPILAGYRVVKDGLDLTGINVCIIPGLASGKLQKCRLRLYQWLGMAHPPTIQSLRSIGASLVHVHFGTDATDIWPSVKAAGMPLLVTLHGYDVNIHRRWWTTGRGGLRRCTYPQRLIRMAHDPAVHFIAVSKAIKERAVDYGIPKAKIDVAYIGVNTKYFQPGALPVEQRHKRILFVGRMVEKKAPLLMIRAFAEVRKVTPDAQLSMVGSGPLLDDAKRIAENLSVPVTFLGACSPEDVRTQLDQARMLCLPSVTAANGDAEGFGLAILEAQSSGVPVVSSALGGATEGLLDGVTGYKFEPGNINGLVSCIVTLLNDSTKTANMSAAALRFASENFNITQLGMNLEKIYSKNLR